VIYKIPPGFNIPRHAQTVLASDFADNPFADVRILVDDVVLDVGAFVGTFSVSALEAGARLVVCFEPEAEALKILCDNLAAYQERAVVVGNAVGANKGIAQLTGAWRPGNVSILPGKYVKPRDLGKTKVESLHAVLKRWRPGVVKLDVEEAEYDILQSLKPGDLRHVHDLFVEFHNWNHHSAVNKRCIGAMLEYLANEGMIRKDVRPRRSLWQRDPIPVGLMAQIKEKI